MPRHKPKHVPISIIDNSVQVDFNRPKIPFHITRDGELDKDWLRKAILRQRMKRLSGFLYKCVEAPVLILDELVEASKTAR